ncbi:divalent metal cation transporter [Cellulophaga baltica]|uniref:NRAMP family divalent metal transporter n=1 Tax=Cellulophaga TaxID=104264 RepID=UPI001C07BFC5|nr:MULTISPECIES: divalent metal cation transporter [Cellulophaga]MBU2996451.1 divalent metal cation transporter [Cellulophaga baltica]MDO6767845.1 divalent metal cation transporter [Cellulophaga sp. 1_MG-2023]
MSKIKILIKNLGPGLLFASMAIGTSHLVLSTKAGAQFGWLMVIPILLANILKYPFFEFGIRYTNVTGKSIIEGYNDRGRGYLWLYAFITLATSLASPAALCAITAGLLINLFKIETVPITTIAFGLFVLNSIILIIGKYKFLENTLKLLIPILFIALLITTGLVIEAGPVTAIPTFETPKFFNELGVLFLITLIGWMPTAVEASSWLSLWTAEKYKVDENKPPLKEALQEFNTGYVLTAVLAILFLTIGCMTLYGSGTELSGNAVTFADQVINLFTTHIGNWAYAFIAVSAFATMYSTCLTQHDAISRVSIDIIGLLVGEHEEYTGKKYYIIGIIVIAAVSIIVMYTLGANMGLILSIATAISFILAPIVGYMNLKNVTNSDFPEVNKPKKRLQILTFVGITFLSLLAIYYGWIMLF